MVEGFSCNGPRGCNCISEKMQAFLLDFLSRDHIG